MSKKRKNPFPPPADDAVRFKGSRPQACAQAEKLTTGFIDHDDADFDDDSPSLGNGGGGFGGIQPRIDPTYGQRGAFPGLCEAGGADGAGEDLFYGPASDGFEYLRMVRSEARGVPNLLVAPSSPRAPGHATISNGLHQNSYEEDNDDGEGGYYADGAYVAVPDVRTSITSRRQITTGIDARTDEDCGVNLDADPQEAYYISLLRRFTALSTSFKFPRQPPPSLPLSYSAPYTADDGIFFSSLNTGEIIHSVRKWRWVLLHRQPTMALMSRLPQRSVINGFTALESVLQRGALRKEGGDQLGAWAWGLLAKCRVVGQMGSEEVSVLRGLGKRAWWLLREIRAGIKDGSREDEDDEDEDDNEGEDEEEEKKETEEENEHEAEDEVEDGEVVEMEEGELASETEDQVLNGHGHDQNYNEEDAEKSNNIKLPFSSTNVPSTSTSTNHNISHVTATAAHTIAISSSGNTDPTNPPLKSSAPSHNHNHNHNHNHHPPTPPKSFMSSPHESFDTEKETALRNAQQRLLERISPPEPVSASASASASAFGDKVDREQSAVEREKREREREEREMRSTAMLDMILTIVGEKFGQRDLLIGRGFWEEG